MAPISSRPRLTLASAVLALVAGAARAGTPPAGFVETVLVPTGAGGISGPVAIEYEPGAGNLWILQKTSGGTQARVFRRTPAGVLTTALTLNNVDGAGERGLLGIAFDPDYADGTGLNRYVYLYYTATTGGSHNRVSRFTESGGTLSGEGVLLDGPILSGFSNHNGGTVRFGADKTLFISMGDNNSDGRAEAQWSQDLTDLRGKILRINRDGSIPSDNPFGGTATMRDEIWAYGLRNPFRFSVDPDTGELYIADVGEVTWESIYRGVSGADHGYPCFEGFVRYGTGVPSRFCTDPPDPAGVTFPIYSYGHGAQTPPVSGNSLTGGPVYRATAFPAEYHGDYFFADYGQGWMRRANIVPNGRLTDVEMFMPDAGGVVDMTVSPSGCLVYVNFNNGGGVREVCAVASANSQPEAVSSADPTAGQRPLDVQFTGSLSSDPDNDTLTYDWRFGDGGTSTAADPLYQYVANGVYQANLTVNDGQGAPNSTDAAPPLRIVVGNEPPVPSITLPTPGSSYVAGQTVDFLGSATDPEDGALGPARFEWTVVFHHGTHTHPFMGPIRGQDSGSFVVPNTGEDAQNVWYRIHLTVTDTGAPLGAAGALSASTFVDIVPVISTVTLVADPVIAGTQLDLNLLRQLAPVSFTTVAGFEWLIGAPDQVLGPRTLTFGSWSDGGAQSHVIQPTGVAEVYTVRYLCNVLEEVQDLRVVKAAGQPDGVIVASWQPVTDICLEDIVDADKYRVWSSPVARPAAMPGAFPSDPAFTVAARSDITDSGPFDPGTGLHFLLVTAVGRDGGNGPVGHYP